MCLRGLCNAGVDIDVVGVCPGQDLVRNKIADQKCGQNHILMRVPPVLMDPILLAMSISVLPCSQPPCWMPPVPGPESATTLCGPGSY